MVKFSRISPAHDTIWMYSPTGFAVAIVRDQYAPGAADFTVNMYSPESYEGYEVFDTIREAYRFADRWLRIAAGELAKELITAADEMIAQTRKSISMITLTAGGFTRIVESTDEVEALRVYAAEVETMENIAEAIIDHYFDDPAVHVSDEIWMLAQARCAIAAKQGSAARSAVLSVTIPTPDWAFTSNR